LTNYVGFDLETTGVSSFRDTPVSFGFVEHLDIGGVIQTVIEEGYINPGVPIPPGAIAVHHITDVMVADATPLAEAVEHIAQRIRDVWTSGGVIVGMNVGYDLTMIESLCHRFEFLPLSGPDGPGAVMDILVIDRHFDKWRKGKRTLGDLCRHYDVTLGDAHSASADAEASLAILEAQRIRFVELDTLEVTQVNSTLRSWYQEWLTSFSSFLEKKGDAPVNPGRYEWPIHAHH
jgi:DNA polymerase III subunit epsilon